MKDNIRKFLDAQNAPGYAGYANAVSELTQGKKLSHWIWYVFPQLKSISQNSPYEKKYGIENIEEARDYLQDPTLKSRLDEVCNILLNHQGKTASSIFGMTDSAKVKSSMTLFYLASKNELYRQVLDKYFNGLACQKTLYALNLTMPSRGTITSQDNTHSLEEHEKHKTIRNVRTANRYNHVNSNNSGRRPSKARKAKKLMILIVGAIFIVGVFGGIGYGIYTLLSQDKLKNPIAENSSPEIDKQTIPDKNLNLVLLTSDLDLIGKNEIEKYNINVSASLGDKTCVMDTTSNSYNFKFTKENSNETIILNASIEGCDIGETTYVYSELNASNDTIEDNIALIVSSTDLRIYEELAWYVSANQQVSEAKYPKYVERIKAVKSDKFATLLTNKLKSIGKVAPKPVEEKKVTNAQSDVLPNEILDPIRHASIIPKSATSNLTPSQMSVVNEYNDFIRRYIKTMNTELRVRVLAELRHCKTIKDLRNVISKYHKWAER